MNNFVYDPMAARQQPVDQAALAAAKQQQAMGAAISSMGMTANPFQNSAVYNNPMAPQQVAAPMPNQAVYGKQQPMQVGEQVFGNEGDRQATVAMINQ